MRLRILIVLLLAGPVVAGETVYDTFGRLSRGIEDPTDDVIAEVEARLGKLYPDWWEATLDDSPLRRALARRLSVDRVRALFERAARDPEEQVERWSILAENLSDHPDLARTLVAIDAVPLMAEECDRQLARIAARALLDGDGSLAVQLLGHPATVVRTARQLCNLIIDPAGLRLVADAVTGALALPPEAHALLGELEPEVYDESRPVRRLGAERRGALLATAQDHPDPAIRRLAAQLLHYAAEPDHGSTIVRALEAAWGVNTDRDEFVALGKRFGSLPGPEVGDLARFSILRGILRVQIMYGGGHPQYAEAFAAWLRKAVAETKGARVRTALLRGILEVDASCMIEELGRIRPTPSFLALLDDLEEGRGVNPPALVALGRRIAARERRFLERGKLRRRFVDPTAGPGLMPLPEALPEASVLDGYPRERVAALLTDPPTRFRKPGRMLVRDDHTGVENRSRLLRLLALAPSHHKLILDADRVLAWPIANRRAAGAALRIVARERGMAAVGELLADDEVAFGFVKAAINEPWGDDLAFAAEVITTRPAVVGPLADWAAEEMTEILGPVDEKWPKRRVALPDAARIAAGEALATAVDPWVEWLAARILALDGSIEAYRLLLLHGDKLYGVTLRSSHPLGDLSHLVTTPDHLAATLEFLERPDVSPLARADLYLSLVERGSDAVREPLRAFAMRRAPLLDADLPEAMLVAARELDLLDPGETRDAVSRIPTFGLRYRALRWLDE